METMQVNLNDTASFLKGLFNPPTNLCFQIFGDKKDSVLSGAYKYLTFDMASKWLIRSNEQGYGIFFMVNAGDGRGRTKSSISRIRAIFVDLDGAPIEPLLEATKEEFCPTAIVETSPQKFHVYWRVSDDRLDMFSKVQRAIARKFHGDISVNDLPRVMRLPGFFHLKGEPFLTRCVSLNPDAEYKLDELIDFFKLDLEEPPLSIGEILQESDSFFPEGTRHQSLIQVAARLRNSYLDGAPLLNALREVNQQRCRPPLTEEELIKISTWVSKKEALPVKAKHKKKENETTIVSWVDLVDQKLPEPSWIIKGILPEGLTVLAGPPKVGKSWLIQGLCHCVTLGTPALGCEKFSTNSGAVLNLALEDPPRRFQSRIKKIANGGEISPNAFFTNKWPTGEDAITSIDEWLENTSFPKMVIVDTFAKIRSGDTSFGTTLYEREYEELSKLHDLAWKHGIALILVHHHKKGMTEDYFEKISGSNAITGVADTIWSFVRPDRKQMIGELTISGRDIGDTVFDLEWSDQTGLWTLTQEEEQTECLFQQVA